MWPKEAGFLFMFLYLSKLSHAQLDMATLLPEATCSKADGTRPAILQTSTGQLS